MDPLEGGMDRRPTLQDVTWLLNLRRYEQLDLEPPYQRRSVWSLREKQRFLDTVLRNYPSPAIFLHQTLDQDGHPTYHVVDGKQRLSAILDFVDNKLRLAKDFGDSRFDGANWKSLAAFPAARKALWSYQLTIEQLDDVQEAVVRDVFERLNRNSRKLEAQEMRHARFDGFLISYLETQSDLEVWRRLKVSTLARRKRMADVQLLSEFALVTYRQDVSGFDQEALDEFYAALEDPSDQTDFDLEGFRESFEETSQFLRSMEEATGVVSRKTTARNNIYSLWSVVNLCGSELPSPTETAKRLETFLDMVAAIRDLDSTDSNRDRSHENSHAAQYSANSVGASTEEPQRRARHAALHAYLIEES